MCRCCSPSFVALLHGLACWFDVTFKGSAAEVVLSTAPYSSGTHWYQCRFCFEQPIAVNVGQMVKGMLDLKVNDDKSYDVTAECKNRGGK